jgi:hypothetical protein
MGTTIKHRRDTTANWVKVNPILAESEIGYDIDKKRFKIGDGATPWLGLKYFYSDIQQGPIGPEGPQGVQGIQGIPGEIGPEGPEGIAGPKGDKGDTGEQGPQGVQGLTGPAGPVGLTWRGVWSSTTDYVADDAVSYSGSAWFATEDPPVGEVPSGSSAYWQIFAQQGAQGDIGPQGPAGPQGDQGPQGEQGIQGVQGEIGPIGPQGVQGIQGIQGPIGPQGIQGVRGARIYAATLAGNAPNPADYPNAIDGDVILDADSGKVWELTP